MYFVLFSLIGTYKKSRHVGSGTEKVANSYSTSYVAVADYLLLRHRRGVMRSAERAVTAAMNILSVYAPFLV